MKVFINECIILLVYLEEHHLKNKLLEGTPDRFDEDLTVVSSFLLELEIF
jgi:hypothetical protein